MQVTQVKKCVDLLYSRSDSEKSYKVVKFLKTEQESQENHYSDDSN